MREIVYYIVSNRRGRTDRKLGKPITPRKGSDAQMPYRNVRRVRRREPV